MNFKLCSQEFGPVSGWERLLTVVIKSLLGLGATWLNRVPTWANFKGAWGAPPFSPDKKQKDQWKTLILPDAEITQGLPLDSCLMLCWPSSAASASAWALGWRCTWNLTSHAWDLMQEWLAYKRKQKHIVGWFSLLYFFFKLIVKGVKRWGRFVSLGLLCLLSKGINLRTESSDFCEHLKVD